MSEKAEEELRKRKAHRRTSEKTNSNSQRCCLGALYYSQSLMDRRLPPICAGAHRKPKSENELEALQTEGANLVDFKYLCLGYSIYDEDRIRSQPDRVNLANGEVNLPYCEGMEVISSRQLQQGPVLLKEGMNGESRPSESEPTEQQKKRGRLFGQRDSVPNFVSDPGKIDWEQLPEKFLKSAHMILSKMQHNGQHLIDNIKRIWDR